MFLNSDYRAESLRELLKDFDEIAQGLKKQLGNKQKFYTWLWCSNPTLWTLFQTFDGEFPKGGDTSLLAVTLFPTVKACKQLNYPDMKELTCPRLVPCRLVPQKRSDPALKLPGNHDGPVLKMEYPYTNHPPCWCHSQAWNLLDVKSSMENVTSSMLSMIANYKVWTSTVRQGDGFPNWKLIWQDRIRD